MWWASLCSLFALFSLLALLVLRLIKYPRAFGLRVVEVCPEGLVSYDNSGLITFSFNNLPYCGSVNNNICVHIRQKGRTVPVLATILVNVLLTGKTGAPNDENLVARKQTNSGST